MPRVHLSLIPQFPKSAGSIKEFDDWDKKMKAEYPRRYKLNEICETIYRKCILFPSWRIRDAKWWVLYRFHPKHRYNQVNVKSLVPGYYDAKDLILHAPFDVFCQFMDRIYEGKSHVLWSIEPGEDDWEHIKEKERDSINTRWAEMQSVYMWWMIERPNRDDIWLEANPAPKIPSEWGPLSMFNDDYRNTPEITAWRAHADLWNTQRDCWEKEDSLMFKRLVDLRPEIWD